MKRDAEAHAAEDKKRRELAEARNAADQASTRLEKLIEEHKGRLTDADTAALRSAIAGVDQARQRDDPAAITRSIDDLRRASQAMAEHLSAASARRRTVRPESGRGKDRWRPADDVIDVEFEDKEVNGRGN